MRRLAGSVLTLACCLGSIAAQATRDGPEFQVNSYTSGYQQRPSIAKDGFGNFVIVWESDKQDGSSLGIFGQRFNSVGTPLGTEFQVNTYTTSLQFLPAVAAAPDGHFVVVWASCCASGGYGISGRIFDAAGSPLGSEFQVAGAKYSYDFYPRVATDAHGDFVVVWQDYNDGSGSGISGRRFDATGGSLGSEFRVNTYTTGGQRFPAVTSDGAGNFVVVWQSYPQDGSGNGVFGRQFDAMGAPLGVDFQVNSYTTGGQSRPSVASDTSGNLVVVWQSYGQDGSGYGIFGRRFDSSGASLGNDFQVNSYTTGSQIAPSVSADTSGNFVVAWQDYGQDGSYSGIFAQRFDAGGMPNGGEFAVNTYTTGAQVKPAAAMDAQGDFVIAWEDYRRDGSYAGIFAESFLGPLSCAAGDADGDAVCDDFDNCLGTYNPTQDDTDHDRVGDACDLMLTSPPGGALLDCSSPLMSQPTITWSKGKYDQFKVFVSSNITFMSTTRVTSGKSFLTGTSWTPPGTVWKNACAKALAANPAKPRLFIKVFGQVLLAPASDPTRRSFSNVVRVPVKP